jgi:hypothetical protein
MSSVTRFIRQVPVSTTYYSAIGVVADSQNLAFEFVPSSSNYVGNYPAGYNNPTGGFVAPASAALQAAIAQAADVNQDNTPGDLLLLRDMGKTIFAPLSNNTTTPATATSPWGYFRQVQLIAPQVITQGPGFMGGVSGSTFGVLGAPGTPDPFTNYLTFYIPVTVAGVTPSANTLAYAIAGGQM